MSPQTSKAAEPSTVLTQSIYPRPKWLPECSVLENILSTFSISLSDLREDKTNSELVDKVLSEVKPGDGEGQSYNFEEYLARIHLALEIQTILLGWVKEGLEGTRRSLLSQWGAETLPGDGMDQIPTSSAMRSRSISTTSSNASTTESRNTNDTNITTPYNSTSEDRPSKRRAIAGENSEQSYISAPPRLSLVTDSLFQDTTTAPAYGYQESDCASAKRKWVEGLSAISHSYSAITPSSALFTPSAISPRTFAPPRSMVSQSPTTPGGTEKGPYLCPFILMDPNNKTHKSCEGKPYPNPRKLKEHIWRYTKPFRCPQCGEGYGRKKTCTIHIEERKTPCKPRPVSEWDDKASGKYEGSAEHIRDQKIEEAKTTQEIIAILREYEMNTKLAKAAGSNTPSRPAGSASSFQDPFTSTTATTNTPQFTIPSQPQSSATVSDAGVPKIVVQSYDSFSAGMNCGSYLPEMMSFRSASPVIIPSNSAPKASDLEGQGWRPMATLSTAPQPPCTPARRNLAQQSTLSPPTTNAQFHPNSPKSPTPELSNMCPSPASSHAESEVSIFEGSLFTPNINVNVAGYWDGNEVGTQAVHGHEGQENDHAWTGNEFASWGRIL